MVSFTHSPSCQVPPPVTATGHVAHKAMTADMYLDITHSALASTRRQWCRFQHATSFRRVSTARISSQMLTLQRRALTYKHYIARCIMTVPLKEQRLRHRRVPPTNRPMSTSSWTSSGLPESTLE